LHPVVAPISDIDIAAACSRNAPRQIELPWTTSLLTEARYQVAVLGESLDAVVAMIYNE
jgi:hypothetical protein